MSKNKSIQLTDRPRRNRASQGLRDLVSETALSPRNLVQPLFIIDGKNQTEPVPSMPEIYRLTVDLAVKEARDLAMLGIPAVALFPNIETSKKDSKASESANPDGLLQRCVQEIKAAVPDMVVVTDVAMDPYSSDGHDGYVKDGQIDNDLTLPILADMAVAQARAGADIVAPSDMMDGRVGYIREALDDQGFTGVGIMSYSVKYCSAFYGPFRDALNSAPKAGDKKTYQMDYRNREEALREVHLDIAEGADIVMVKPALSYLDVIRVVREAVDVPVAAYNVSGEYSMIKAAAQRDWIDEDAAVTEMLTSIKRAGTDIIFTYFAKQFARM